MALADAPVTAAEAWHSIIDREKHQHPGFPFVENRPGLPNVFLYGDSISIAYTARVREQLADTANVYRLHTNGGDSNGFIERLTRLETTMRDPRLQGRWTFDWDVIHFNVGLHDLKHVTADGKLDLDTGRLVSTTETYAANLRAIVRHLRETYPGASLIFATTTPVPANSRGRKHDDAVHYNAVALEVLREFPEVRINDLHALSAPKQPEWWVMPGDVHYRAEGSNAQGDQVAEAITDCLAARR